MKILVLTSTYESCTNQRIPTFVKDQIESMASSNATINFSILAPYDYNLQTIDKEQNKVKVHYFQYIPIRSLHRLTSIGIWPSIRKNPIKITLIPCLFIATVINTLIAVIKIKPDIIYAHWFVPQGLAAAIVSKWTRTPYVLTSHSSDVDILSKIPWLGAWLAKRYIKRASAITAVSKRTLNKIRVLFSNSEWDVIKENTYIVPMGVFNHRANKKEEDTQRTILFIGRLTEKKGVLFLVRAFDIFYQKEKSYRLVLAGTGPLDRTLRREVEKLKSKTNIDFVGHIEGRKKEKVIRDSEIIVVPSIITNHGDAEGLPVSLLEGLIAGKLCIATNESGADDIIKDGENGFLVPQKSTKHIAERLMEVAILSRLQKNKISKKAKDTGEDYTWDRIASKYIEILRKAKHRNYPRR